MSAPGPHASGDALDEAVAEYQALINSGVAWRLEGRIGGRAMWLIQTGRCALGPVAHTDAYGNRVPARGEIRPGAPGSAAFVLATTGRAPEDKP